MAPLLSFLLPTVGAARRAHLLRLFASADQQTRPDFEFIVVDQGEPRLDTLLSMPPYVRYVFSEQRGLSLNRNRALALAQGELIALADDDCLLPANYVESVARNASRLQGQFAFALGRVLAPGDGQPVIATFGTGLRPGRAVSAWSLDTTISCGIIIRRAGLEQIGGFDEAFGLGAPYPAAEETDMLLRLLAQGFRGRYLPEIVIYHPRHTVSASESARYTSYGYAAGALARKHWASRRAGLFRLRFGYSLARSLGGAALAAARRNGLAHLYWQHLRAKMRGFLAYRE